MAVYKIALANIYSFILFYNSFESQWCHNFCFGSAIPLEVSTLELCNFKCIVPCITCVEALYTKQLVTVACLET